MNRRPAPQQFPPRPIAHEQEVLMGLQEAEQGEFASAEEVACVFARYCPETQDSIASRVADFRRQGKGGSAQALLRDRAADRAKE